MELKLYQFILNLMKRAHYEYDPSVKEWVGWIRGVPGIYAQGKNVEEVRAELIATLEDSLLIDFGRGKKIPGFLLAIPMHWFPLLLEEFLL